MSLMLEIKKVRVTEANNHDIIILETEFPRPLAKMCGKFLHLSIMTAKGDGVEYVKENFGIDTKREKRQPLYTRPKLIVIDDLVDDL